MMVANGTAERGRFPAAGSFYVQSRGFRFRDERDVVNTTIDLTTRLEQLRDEYTYRLNLLLDEGREDLAAKLNDEYLEAAARALAEH
jgi:hypothetical protein